LLLMLFPSAIYLSVWSEPSDTRREPTLFHHGLLLLQRHQLSIMEDKKKDQIWEESQIQSEFPSLHPSFLPLFLLCLFVEKFSCHEIHMEEKGGLKCEVRVRRWWRRYEAFICSHVMSISSDW
jgi:hypothetical protein